MIVFFIRVFFFLPGFSVCRLNVLLKQSQSCAACAVLSGLVFVGFVFVRIGTDPTGIPSQNLHHEPTHPLAFPRVDSALDYQAQRSDQIQRFYANAAFQTSTAPSPFIFAGQPLLGNTYTTRLPDRFISRDSVTAGSYKSTDLDDE